MIGLDVPMRGKAKINNPVKQGQSDPAVFPQRVEDHMAVSIIVGVTRHAGAGIIGAVDYYRAVGDRAVGALRARGYIQCMETVNVTRYTPGNFLGLGFNIHCAGNRIYNWSRCNADFRRDVSAANVAAKNRRNARSCIQETDLPQRRAIGSHVVVGVKSVNALVFGDYVHDVVDALAGDRHIGHHQWLAINVTIHRM